MLHVKIWLVSLIILIFSGCSQQPEISKIVYVPQKCVIPVVDPLVLDHTSYLYFGDVLKRVSDNSERKSEYIEKLFQAQKVCE